MIYLKTVFSFSAISSISLRANKLLPEPIPPLTAIAQSEAFTVVSVI